MSVASSGTPAKSGLTRLRGLVVDRSVRTKIFAALGALALVSVIVGGLAVKEITSLDHDADAMARLVEQVGFDRGLVDADQARARLLVAQLESAVDDASRQVYRQQVKELDDQIAATIDKVDAAGGAQAMSSWPAVVDGWHAWQQVRDTSLIPAAMAGDGQAYQAAVASQAGPAATALEDALSKSESEVRAEAHRLADAANASAASSRVVVVVALVAGLVVGSALAFVVAAGITRSLQAVQRALKAMAGGDLTARARVATRDEIGQMADDLSLAQESVRSIVEGVARSSAAVSASSEELSAASTQIAAGAEETSTQASVVAAAAEQVSNNVQTVATGAEEMAASINEIAQSANDAARVAHEAVDVVQSANSTITQLASSSDEIGAVVKVITTIAEQTNLLALNATIEAARAGEAGKGFAVVAGEVKELAQETARATGDIAGRVEAIQNDSRSAAEAMSRVSDIIASIDGYQIAIASAVEEQTATTAEMSRSVVEAASGSGQIAENIVGVADASSSTSEAVSQSRMAIDELARLAADLNDEITRFTV